MADIEDIRKKIDKLITDKGFNYRELSLKIGRKDSYIQQYVKYGYPRRLKEIDRFRLARLLGVDDKELMDDEIIASRVSGGTGEECLSMEDKNAQVADEYQLAGTDIVKLHLQGDVFYQEVIGKQYLSRNIWDDLSTAEAKAVKIIKVVSDSMKPTINLGDYVWVDTSYQTADTDGLYLFGSGRDISIKRVQISPLDGTAEISCDNDKYKSYQTPDISRLKVLGRIMLVLQKV